MVKMLPEIKKAGASWQPKAAEVPAVLVTKETVEAIHRRASGRAASETRRDARVNDAPGRIETPRTVRFVPRRRVTTSRSAAPRR